eukprot:XP_006592529.1 K(+) efflux antiporter 4 isoform X1 [Glycine max]
MVDDPMLRSSLPAPRVAQAAMFSLIPEDWGEHVSPWVKEISQYFDCLKSLHFRRMIVKDSDLQNLARDRGHVLHALKLDKCFSFTTDGLFHIGRFCNDKLGLSLELDSFATGVMISTTDLGQHTLEQVEPIRNFFAALFLASIGMLIHVHFLWNHVDILLAVVILVIIIKTIVTISVVKGFGYNNKTSLLVGMSLAQIKEFAFVLLNRASNIHLVKVCASFRDKHFSYFVVHMLMKTVKFIFLYFRKQF